MNIEEKVVKILQKHLSDGYTSIFLVPIIEDLNLKCNADTLGQIKDILIKNNWRREETKGRSYFTFASAEATTAKTEFPQKVIDISPDNAAYYFLVLCYAYEHLDKMITEDLAHDALAHFLKKNWGKSKDSHRKFLNKKEFSSSTLSVIAYPNSTIYEAKNLPENCVLDFNF